MLQEIKLAMYIEQYGDHWADELPENCPPEDVCTAEGDVFYRFTKNIDCIVPEDWYNHLTLFPEREYSADRRILAAGLSLWNTEERILKEKKLPIFRKIKCDGLAKISLIPEDGVILQTTKEIHHHTWWRTTMCNLAKAESV